MRAIVHPARGNYQVFFLDDHARVRGTGIAEVVSTTKGVRPVHYRLRWGGKRQYKNTPSKDLIASLRKSDVELTRRDQVFETFLHDFQIQPRFVNLCRICLIEERITPLVADISIEFRPGENICFDCAKRELRREVAQMGRVGRQTVAHLEELLFRERSLEKALASLQPEQIQMSRALFDRLESHPAQETQKLDELPLPRNFVDASGVERLMPAQQLAVEAGLLYGKDLLIVSATASGKTFIGEMAGLKNFIEGRGRMLFLVPLVALAVQKYRRFDERYGKLAGAGLLIGKTRLNLPENRPFGDRNTQAPILVGTYEGVDHMIRCGEKISKIGTVVIDEVQMLEDSDRGHRLDGLIARLKYLAPKAQFLYLSATIGAPKTLATKLNSGLVRYAERPVSLDRFLLFLEKKQKIASIKRLTEEEFARKSTKGFRGQTIVFTFSRARCQLIADALGPGYSAYHAGLSAQERREVESRFASGKIKAVITTAALGAGVDFPASQVIFDSLAMGIKWLSVGEFNQMAGRAGRPDFHDAGRVVILAEPGCTYSRESKVTEEEMALLLLKGEMEEVAPHHSLEASGEEFVSNAVACRGDERDLDRIQASMVGSTEPVLSRLMEEGLVRRAGGMIELTEMAKVMARHFIGPVRLLEIRRLVREVNDPIEILAELEGIEENEEESRGKERKQTAKRR